MGWRGTLRSINASIRRAEREERRRARELAREAKEAAQRHQEELAAHIVARYQAHLAALTTVHRECGPQIDWRALALTADPAVPAPIDTASTFDESLRLYEPGWFARTFGLASRRRRKLASQRDAARIDDERVNREAAEKYQADRREAAAMRELSAAVIGGDAGALQVALDDLDPFDELRELGVEVAVSFPASATAVVELAAHERSVVPEQQESLTARGKLSSKKMPKGLGNEIYQDYICGAALRACREVFAALPLEWVIVTVRADMLDSRTGHVDMQPVLSLAAPRRTIERLRYEALDPSDAMENFLCRMTFKKGSGMARVEPLSPGEIGSMSQSQAGSARS